MIKRFSVHRDSRGVVVHAFVYKAIGVLQITTARELRAKVGSLVEQVLLVDKTERASTNIFLSVEGALTGVIIFAFWI